MKKLTLSLWLALAAAGIFAVQACRLRTPNVDSISHLPAVLSAEVNRHACGEAPSPALPQEIIHSVGTGWGLNTLNHASQQRVIAATK